MDENYGCGIILILVVVIALVVVVIALVCVQANSKCIVCGEKTGFYGGGFHGKKYCEKHRMKLEELLDKAEEDVKKDGNDK